MRTHPVLTTVIVGAAVVLPTGCGTASGPTSSPTVAGSTTEQRAPVADPTAPPPGWPRPTGPVRGRLLFNVVHEGDLAQPVYIDESGLHLIPLPPDPTIAHLTWGPAGSIVYDRVVDGHRHLFKANVDGTAIVQLTDGDDASQDSPSVSPDGTLVAYAEASDPGGNDHGLQLMRIDGTHLRSLTRPSHHGPRVGVDGASISPDGRTVAYYRVTNADRGRAGLWLVGIDGRGDRRLTDDGTQPDTPRWTPDGRTLVFAAHVAGTQAEQKLWTVSVSDRGRSAPHPLLQAPDPGSMLAAAVSPDGREVAFQYLDLGGAGSELRVIGIDGTAMRTIWRAEGSGGAVEGPQWAP